jgi:Tfp pilus assembly protein PilF
MKKYFFTSIMLLLATIIFAQTKPKQKEKPPTQKELNDMMQEMQKSMTDMSPEDKKAMDSLGFKMPDTKNSAKQYDFANKNVSQQQKNSISGIETIPAKDAARIAALPKTIFSESQFILFLQNVTVLVSKKMSAASKKIADDEYTMLKKQNKETFYLANAANGMWMYGEPEAAIELMGRAVMENTADADNLNNYASFLTMNGGEHLALPILQKLNQQYPGNSTILNNIGQAWFGLGDLVRSEKYLDSAIHLFAGHSQANYTKCIIEESKGNKTAAIDCIKKSIKTAYSEEKINKLKKLGGKLNANDISWNFPKPGDALGLDKMLASRPDFYFSKSQRQEFYPQWQKYLKGCQHLLENYMLDANKNDAATSQSQMMNNLSSGKIPNSNFIMDKALQLLNIVLTDENEFMGKMEKKSAYLYDSIMSASNRLGIEVITTNDYWEKKYQKELAAHPPTGSSEVEQSAKMDEMHGRFMQSACQELKPKVDAFLEMYNRKIYDLNVEWVSRIKYFINEVVYYLRYSSPTEADYQKSKNLYQTLFLECISGSASFVSTPVDFQLGCNSCADIITMSGICKDAPEDDENQFQPLPDFDIIHCNSHIVLWTPVGQSNWDCNIRTVKMDIGVLKFDHKENMINGQTISASAEFGIYKGVGSRDFGPIKAELKAGGGGFIEWGPKGVSDFGVKVGVKAEAGPAEELNPIGKTLEIGAEARWGWSSGPSLEGDGLLKNVFKKEN